MRRMRELTAEKPEADPTAGAGPPHRRAASDAFGGVGAFVAAPDMARTPAVDRAIKSGAEADR